MADTPDAVVGLVTGNEANDNPKQPTRKGAESEGMKWTIDLFAKDQVTVLKIK